MRQLTARVEGKSARIGPLGRRAGNGPANCTPVRFNVFVLPDDDVCHFYSARLRRFVLLPCVRETLFVASSLLVFFIGEDALL